MSFRIIPRLDVKGRNLVKGIHLEGLRVLGPIEPYAKYYFEQGADELRYVDAVASLYGRNSLTDVIADTSKNGGIPLAVGGLQSWQLSALVLWIFVHIACLVFHEQSQQFQMQLLIL